jgi:protein translocase SecG subunit
MNIALLIVQMVSAFLLVVVVLVQSKGSGLGKAWGGGGGTSFTRRGLEKLIFRSTFVIAFIFIASSLLQLFV